MATTRRKRVRNTPPAAGRPPASRPPAGGKPPGRGFVHGKLLLGAGLVSLLFGVVGVIWWQIAHAPTQPLRSKNTPSALQHPVAAKPTPPVPAVAKNSGGNVITPISVVIPSREEEAAPAALSTESQILYEEKLEQILEEESPPPPLLPPTPASPRQMLPSPGKSPGLYPAPSARAMPRVAIIIDDLGYHGEVSKAIALLPEDVTLAILPRGPYSRQVAELGKKEGKEIILHQPMEPIGYPQTNPGPGALLMGMAEEQMRRILQDNLARFPEAVGVNNHMGSRLTSDSAAMAVVMKTLAEKRLFFVDSRTSPQSVGYTIAGRYGVPRGGRDIFLDNVQRTGEIMGQLAKLEARARLHGEAVGIGHPYPETLAALERWLPGLAGKGIHVVRASQLLGPVTARSHYPATLAMRRP